MNFEAPFVSVYIGVFLLAGYAWIGFAPSRAIPVLKGFARSVWPAWILVALSVAWFAYNLNQVDLGRFNIAKRALWVAVPVAVYGIVTFIPDLLAVRGLCTFLLLAGQPVLIAVRWHGSISQYAVAILLYVLMVECMVLVVYPHFWIRGLDWIGAKPERRKLSLFSGVAIGISMLACGVISL